MRLLSRPAFSLSMSWQSTQYLSGRCSQIYKFRHAPHSFAPFVAKKNEYKNIMTTKFVWSQITVLCVFEINVVQWLNKGAYYVDTRIWSQFKVFLILPGIFLTLVRFPHLWKCPCLVLITLQYLSLTYPWKRGPPPPFICQKESNLLSWKFNNIALDSTKLAHICY